MRTYLVTGFAALACTFATPALSASVIFSGQDPGVGPGGPFPNSSAAEAAFLAAAGLVSTTVKTETFESATVGTFTPLVLDDFTITTTAANFGPPYSGVNNTTLGALYGFNTTPGGEKWYGFPDFVATEATLTFDNAILSLGTWMTGIQELYTAEVTLELVNGSQEVFVLPLNNNGGAQFYGIVSTIPFSKVLIRQLNNPGFADAFGIDDISYGFAPVPEPASWAMLITGFGLAGFAFRRRAAKRARLSA